MEWKGKGTSQNTAELKHKNENNTWTVVSKGKRGKCKKGGVNENVINDAPEKVVNDKEEILDPEVLKNALKDVMSCQFNDVMTKVSSLEERLNTVTNLRERMLKNEKRYDILYNLFQGIKI